MRRFWYASAGVLALVGCLGLAATVPTVRRAISPRAAPAPLPLHVTGPRYDQFIVDLDRPGRYAVWATRPTTAPDRDRCRTTGPDGRAVPSTEPGRVVEWTEVATDDTRWTWLASVDAPAPGRYAFSCRLDPDSPGQQYAVTRAPDARLGARLWLERYRGLLVAALPVGLVILLMTVTWRRSNE
ncbi:hypothetical protein U2F26_15885 [Micromonospora sp. 4G57]|uniref:Uncharacterized protein n=1 Tax=Micromonospora sicca TaxID=2202420 RepID=A0ABU5JA27_9ACTN|nr:MULTISPECIES: hypothetical protein [unclassified Micromonospora]MDZ5444201.1 hypothetical protein [Micromonospora sp. 4G57]MDZ5489445.1 hypothetical protein [Micromonospora sp. 4G53]